MGAIGLVFSQYNTFVILCIFLHRFSAISITATDGQMSLRIVD